MFYVIARFREEIGSVLIRALNAKHIIIEQKSYDNRHDQDGEQN